MQKNMHFKAVVAFESHLRLVPHFNLQLEVTYTLLSELPLTTNHIYQVDPSRESHNQESKRLRPRFQNQLLATKAQIIKAG